MAEREEIEMTKMISTFAALLLAATVARAAVPPDLVELARKFEQFPASKGQGSESERLQKQFDLIMEHTMRTSPELATYAGFQGLNNRWTDSSFEAMEFRRALTRKALEALLSVDRSQLKASEQVNYDLARRRLERRIEGERFHSEYMAVSQIGGVQQSIPQLLSAVSAREIQDYEDILTRLRSVPTAVEQAIALLEKGLKEGITPPRITLRELPAQVGYLFVDDPMTSPMLRAFQKFPSTIPAPEQERLKKAAVQTYTDLVDPAFRKLQSYLANTYVPAARESIAMSDLPDGKAWYAFNVRGQTTTDLAPEEIHQIGLAEVARIRKLMDEVIASTGFQGSFADFLKFLRSDPRFFYDKPEDLLAGYRDIAKRIDPELVKLFGKLPRLPYGVIPAPPYVEKSQTTAYYQIGSVVAGRPGYFNVNTYDVKSRPKWEMEALTAHETVPGHHVQTALAQELEDAPEWRKYDSYTAYAEGWGLYAESLGGEIGLYKDPYSRFGQLTYEMWRAIRLVVDTGIHTKGWTRQQAIDYFKANAGSMADADIEAEVDRYIAWPGQALAYKIGELKIKELRAYGEKELGTKFDLRAFHDHILGSGALPLDLLEKSVKEWVEQVKAEGKTAP
jgi:uncharacterized protein (DUF885 family)